MWGLCPEVLELGLAFIPVAPVRRACTKSRRTSRASSSRTRLGPRAPSRAASPRSPQCRPALPLPDRLSLPFIPSCLPNDGSALRHGHHFEPVDFVIDHGRGHHDAYSAGSCQRTYARACGCRQRPRRHREKLIESERGVVRPRGVRNDDADRRPWARKRPFRTRPAERGRPSGVSLPSDKWVLEP